jgi:hypothetical protein
MNPEVNRMSVRNLIHPPGLIHTHMGIIGTLLLPEVRDRENMKDRFLRRLSFRMHFRSLAHNFGMHWKTWAHGIQGRRRLIRRVNLNEFCPPARSCSMRPKANRT